jgi:excisionase family DNA binding protein
MTKARTTTGRDARMNLLTVKDVAARLSVSTKSVRRWIDQGELAVHRLGRQLRITEEDITMFLRVRRNGFHSCTRMSNGIHVA